MIPIRRGVGSAFRGLSAPRLVRAASIFLLLGGFYADLAAGQTFTARPETPGEFDLKAKYGLLRYDEPGGNTADNAAALETYMAASASVEGPGKATRPGRLPGGWFPILTTIDGPQLSGVRLEGNSCETDVWSRETTNVLGAGVTQIVMEDTTPPGATMLTVRAGGMRLSDINIRGYGGSNPQHVWDNKALWAAIGVHLLDPEGGIGSGKMQGDALGLMALDKGIVLGEDVNGNQADEIIYQRIVGVMVNTLIETRNQQSVNNHITNLHCYGVEEVLNLEGGGTFEIGTCYVGAVTLTPVLRDTLFLRTGTTDGVSANANNVHVNTLRPDGSMYNFRIWAMDKPAECTLSIDYLDSTNAWAPTTPSRLLAGARLVINAADNMPDNFISYDQDANDDDVMDGKPIEIVINAIEMREFGGTTEDVRDLIANVTTGDCDGVCYVTVLSGTTRGSSAGPIAYKQKWVDGELTNGWTRAPSNERLMIGTDPAFSNGKDVEITINDTSPQILMYDSDYTSGQRLWGLAANGGTLSVQAIDDSNSSPTSIFALSRSGAITFPAGVRQTFRPNGINAGINVGSYFGDHSTPQDGDIWYNGAGNVFKVHANGTTFALGPAFGTADLDTADKLANILGAGDFSGTGAFARVSSPTFTTPNLGTPSAATLTFATGLPISTGVSGLGTGVATALAIATNGNGGFVTTAGSSTVGQVLRVTGANAYGWGAVDLADADAIANDLPFGNLTQGAARSVLGVSGDSAADVASITAGSDHAVLRRNGTSLGFGAINLASANAVTGTLPESAGGTGITVFGSGVAAALAANATGSSGGLVRATAPTINNATLSGAVGLPAGGDVKIGTVPTFSGGNGAEITMSDTFPQILMYDSDWTSDARLWGLSTDTGAFTLHAINDANSIPTLLYSVDRTGAFTFATGVTQLFKPNGTNSGLNVGSHAGDPSSADNGDLWYDSTANELTAQISGVNQAVSTRGAVTATSASTLTPAGGTQSNYAHHSLQGETLAIANPSGSPVSGYRLTVRVRDNGTSRTLNWGTAFRNGGVAMPTATTANKWHTVEFIYNAVDSKWDCVAAVVQQ